MVYATIYTYMWLIHIFIFAYTESICLQYVSNSVVFYVIQVIFTLFVSWIMCKAAEMGKKIRKEKGNHNDNKKLFGKI